MQIQKNMIEYLQFVQKKEGYMRINGIENRVGFGNLYLRTNQFHEISEEMIRRYEQKLANTKHIDLIIDSHGFAIKDKMTDFLQRIQSFSLFPQENAVGINMDGLTKKIYKFTYKTLDEAKKAWKDLYTTAQQGNIKGYADVAIWLDNKLEETKRD